MAQHSGAEFRDGVRSFAETFLDPPLDAARRVCRFGAWVGGVVLILSTLLISYEIFIRKVFSLSTGGADELSGYGLAIAATWAFGFGLVERSHIRVDTIYAYFPARLKALCDILGVALFLLIFGLMCYYGWNSLADSFRVGARSRTGLYIPLIYPQFLWWLGLALTVVVATLLLLRGIAHFIAGDVGSVQKIIGTRGIQEEIDEELALVEQQRRRDRGASSR